MISVNSAPRGGRLSRLDLAAIGATAIVARLPLVVVLPDAGLFSDMLDYHSRAEIILRDGFLNFDSWRGPGYPLLLAALYALPTPDLLTARVANAGIAGLTAAFTAALALRFTGRAGALLAGLVVAFYPAAIVSSIYIMPEGLYGLLLVLALLLAERATVGSLTLAGIVCGYAALTRSLGMALIGSVVLAHLVVGRQRGDVRTRVPAVVAFALAAGLTIAPWFVHTTRVSGGVMLDSASPFNVLAGSNPRATGRLELPDYQWLFDTYLSGARDEAERNALALARSAVWMRDNPGAWLRLAPVKFMNLWGLEGREHIWLYANSYFGPRQRSTVTAWGIAILVGFPLLACPAVLGLFRPGLARSLSGLHIALLLLLVSALHLVSFGESRFHLPMVPLLAIMAVRGVVTPEPIGRGRLVGFVTAILALGSAWALQAADLIVRLRLLVAADGWRSGLLY